LDGFREIDDAGSTEDLSQIKRHPARVNLGALFYALLAVAAHCSGARALGHARIIFRGETRYVDEQWDFRLFFRFAATAVPDRRRPPINFSLPASDAPRRAASVRALSRNIASACA
jgi:hypothetical protein